MNWLTEYKSDAVIATFFLPMMLQYLIPILEI